MKNSDVKNVLAVHDMSGFGKCSLSVIIPALTAMGVQVTPIPTAVLSTHTGGFDDFTFTDMTDSMIGAANHYKKLGIHFDAVYTGFLGSEKQIEIVSEIIEMNKGSFIFVDPVMGDDGKIYRTYTAKMCDDMRELVKKADLITPNLTEAYILTGNEYENPDKTDPEEAAEKIKEIAEELSRLCRGIIIITGIEIGNNICNAVYENGKLKIFKSKKEAVNFPGTGDLFASVLLGCLLSGKDTDKSTAFAAKFLSEVIADTAKAKTPVRNGLMLERHMRKLCR